jgi:hypothetical protein
MVTKFILVIGEMINEMEPDPSLLMISKLASNRNITAAGLMTSEKKQNSCFPQAKWSRRFYVVREEYFWRWDDYCCQIRRRIFKRKAECKLVDHCCFSLQGAGVLDVSTILQKNKSCLKRTIYTGLLLNGLPHTDIDDEMAVEEVK